MQRKKEKSNLHFPQHTNPLWIGTSEQTNFARLDHDLDVDVAIVGGGITGITAALLLKRAGKRVALIEKDRVAAGETGHTTAHLTAVIDVRTKSLISHFGKEGARLAFESTRDALQLISRIVDEERIDCHFKRVPAYLYTEESSDVDYLREEAEASEEVGLECEFTKNVPLPFPVKGAVLFRDQAQFHPREYLLPLVRKIDGDGSRVFEQTHVTNCQDGEPCVVETTGGKIRCTAILVAANVPINNRVLLHTKIAAYRTYAIAAPAKSAASVDGLFWDTEDPYHYTRSQMTRDGTFLIIGGEDHKTGQEEDTEKPFQKLLEYARSRFKVKEVAYRWSGQIIEPVDGLPYIGRNSFSKNVYVATGYAGVGMTGGTLAAMINSDLILGRDNRYADLYDPTRIKFRGAALEYVSENVDYPAILVADRLTSHDVTAKSVENIPFGEGAIVEIEGKKMAVHRDASGGVHRLSTVCTHLGCDVRWNSAEKSWDCPCHGSRFTPEGEVVNGPAVSPLQRL